MGEEPSILASLARDGYALTDPLLTGAMLADIAAFLREQEAVVFRRGIGTPLAG